MSPILGGRSLFQCLSNFFFKFNINTSSILLSSSVLGTYSFYC